MTSSAFVSPVPTEPLFALCERVKAVAHTTGNHALFTSANRARATIAGELQDLDAVHTVLQVLCDGSTRWSVEDHRDQRALSAWFCAWLAYDPQGPDELLAMLGGGRDA